MDEGVTRCTYGDHPAQYADLYRPEVDVTAGVAVVIHGGFWRSGYDATLGAPLCADLAARGYTAWNLEYRQVGDGGGWPATFDDVAAGIDLLATVAKINTSGVVTIGHSAGGQLAVWAAARSALPVGAPGAGPKVGVTAAISQAGVLNLALAANSGVGGTAISDLLGGAPNQIPETYALADPSTLVPMGTPIRALHARDDDSVPFDQSTSFVQAARAAGGDARLIEVSGGHFGLIDVNAPAWQATVAALEGLLR